MDFRLRLPALVWIVLASIVGIAGCAQVKTVTDTITKELNKEPAKPVPAEEVKVKQVPYAKLSGQGMKIAAEDRSFVLTDSSKPTPFHSQCLGKNGDKLDGNIVEAHATAGKLGGKRVRVTVPQLASPLYGILMLCEVEEQASGAASRVHLVEAPDEYVKKAQGGRISVVYSLIDSGRVRLEKTNNPYQPYKQVPINHYGWILWLSDTMIPQ